MTRSKQVVAFDRQSNKVDAFAATITLAAGAPVHVARSDTPEGCVVRILPNGSEELVRVDLDAAARLLGK
jgi:hypothetical protein